MPANTGLSLLMKPKPRVSRFMLKSVFLLNQQQQAPAASQLDLARNTSTYGLITYFTQTIRQMMPTMSVYQTCRVNRALSLSSSMLNAPIYFFLDPFEVALLGIANLIYKSLFATKTANDTSARFTRWNPPRLRLNSPLQLYLHRPQPAVSSISQLKFES